MRFLLQPKSNILSKEVILARVWGYDSNAVENHVEVYVGFLRKKLQSPDYDEASRSQFSTSILVMSKQMRDLVERMLELARAASVAPIFLFLRRPPSEQSYGTLTISGEISKIIKVPYERGGMMRQQYELFDTNHKLIRNLWDIHHTMRYISEGKGSQKRILMILRENQDMTQRELTEYLGIQPGSVSEVIGKLVSAGLIQRTPSHTDRRTADIRLTEAGETAAEEAHTKREQRHQDMFACLSENEKQTLLVLLEKLNASWSQQYRCNETDGSVKNGSGRGQELRGTKSCGNT